MAKSLVIEEESGDYTGTPHPHNGYYAGDFTSFAFTTGEAILLAPSFPKESPLPAAAAA